MANEQQDESEAVRCSDCGESLYPATSRSYSLGDRGELCWSCAMRRGGSYDADEERWVVAPSTDDLRRPWSPR